MGEIRNKKDKHKKIEIGKLVEDMDVYPRTKLDHNHVNHIKNAIRLHRKLPEILVDAATLRVVDGFHRRSAYMQLFGPKHKVRVTLRKYPYDSVLFMDAMYYNSGHGSNLTSYDRAHCRLVANKLGIDDTYVCAALGITQQTLAGMKVYRFGKVTVDDAQIEDGECVAEEEVPLKTSITHMAGKTLNRDQVNAIPGLSGSRQVAHVNELIKLIDTDLLDTDNQYLMEQLEALRIRLDRVL